MIKKLISITLSIVLLFSVCLSVSAEGSQILSEEITVSKYNSSNFHSSNTNDKFPFLWALLIDGFSKGNYNIDISSLGLCDYSVLEDCIAFISGDFPDALLLNHFNVSYKYDSDSGVILSVVFEEIENASYKKDLAEFKASVKSIIRNMPDLKTDLEKALYIYNYLILNFEYDHSHSHTVYDPLNMIREKKGVCEAYTLLYTALMDELEIKCISAYHDAQSATEAGHMWNMVEIEDEWYHVDATWGDTGNLGEVCYDYFLIDDTKLAEADSQTQDHGNYYTYWEKIFSETETSFVKGNDKYSYKVWHNAASPLTYCNGAWYYVEEDGSVESLNGILCKVTDNSFDKNEKLTTVSNHWPYFDENGYLNSNYYWPGYHGSIFTLGNYVCLSSPNGIHYYDTTSKQKELKELELVGFSNNTFPIYGCTYDGRGNVTVETKIDPNTLSCNADIKTYKVKAMQSYNGMDISKITKYLVTGELSENWGLYDVSGDLGIDIRDLVRMKKISAGIE